MSYSTDLDIERIIEHMCSSYSIRNSKIAIHIKHAAKKVTDVRKRIQHKFQEWVHAQEM